MILDEICAHVRDEVEHRKRRRPLSDVVMAASTVPPTRDFDAALRAPGMSLIAEVKKASPSRGILFPDMDPAALGRDYEQAGVNAISVLTEEHYFQGSLENLRLVHAAVTVPCLRKDFIVDAYQIHEARASFADAVLLITRILTDEQLRDYLALAHTQGLAVLVETHNQHEVERALKAGAVIIGVNNRDLATFTVDFETTLRLRADIPRDRVMVAESGIHTRADVVRLQDAGVDAVLVGESLVTSGNISAKVAELLGR